MARAVAVGPRAESHADSRPAGAAIAAFGTELFAAARRIGGDYNLSLSPTSIAIALGMLEPGTTGDAQVQLREVLHISDPVAFHTSMNRLEQDLVARLPDDVGPHMDGGELVLRIANAAYLRQGYPFEPAYLHAVGANYGPVLYQADFASDPDAVAADINRFIAQATADRITDLVGPGTLTPLTVLVLVNALYLNASWLSPFHAVATEPAPFTRLDGSATVVPMMHSFGESSAQGDGWVAASKALTGRLRVQFVLPDPGRFERVAAMLGDVWAAWERAPAGQTPLGIPRFDTRTTLQLDDALASLGLTAPYDRGNLLGVAPDPQLAVDAVLHETFVSFDEDGIEAAAATVMHAAGRSAPAKQPEPVVLDRPFLYRILDDRSGATLFLGQILDPRPDGPAPAL